MSTTIHRNILAALALAVLADLLLTPPVALHAAELNDANPQLLT